MEETQRASGDAGRHEEQRDDLRDETMTDDERVDEAGRESFPASDPPSFSALSRIGPPDEDPESEEEPER